MCWPPPREGPAMPLARRLSVLLGLLGTLGVPAADATDRPIGGTKLVVKRLSSGKQKMRFESDDGGFLFPAIGSDDDPSGGAPGGAMIELFSPVELGRVGFPIPPGRGNPGWKVKRAKHLYRFRSRLAPLTSSPVKEAGIVEGRGIEVVANAAGLALGGPQGSVGIRITTGTLRN